MLIEEVVGVAPKPNGLDNGGGLAPNTGAADVDGEGVNEKPPVETVDA